MRLLELLFRPLAGGPLSFAWRFLSFVVLALAGRWASHEYALSRALAASRWTEPRRVVLRSAAGLKLGSRVLLDGIEVGSVVVSPTVRRDLGGAMVRVAVTTGTDLRVTDEVSVSAGLGTLSGAVLSIQTAGPQNAKPWLTRDLHRGTPALTVDALAAKVATVALDVEGFLRTATRELNRNRDAISSAVSGISTLAVMLSDMAAEDRAAIRSGLASIASIAAKADASRIVESVDLLTDQLARSLPAIARDTGAILATGAELATTASAVLAQVSRARKAAGRLRVGATSTTLVEAHGRRLASVTGVSGTLDGGQTTGYIEYETGSRGGISAQVGRRVTDGVAVRTGTIFGQPAAGVDIGGDGASLSVDGYRLPDPVLRFTGRMPIAGQWSGIARLDDVTRTKHRELMVGAEARW